ncbi:MAG: ABC transporter ATP-binding protein [Nitrososphaerota archaeon]
MTDKPVIETRSLVKVYRAGPIEVPALRGISLKFFDEDFVAIVGPSGSGKSTLLNVLGALDRPTSGQVIIDGIDISTLDDNQLADLRNRKIGFVFQMYNLLPRMSIMKNVELPLIVRGLPTGERREKVLEAIKKVGLEHKADSKPPQLSGGEQQRVAIARAIVSDPKIMLADEPTGNLDSKSANVIIEIFKNLNKEGRTIVVVTHNPEVAYQTKRIIRLRDGVIEREEVLISG